MKHAEPTVIFVYNADSGVFNLAADIAHKIFSPQTYSCNLCVITHSTFRMKNEWRDYLETFEAEYRIQTIDLPAVFMKSGDGLKMIIDSAAINACRTIADLKHLINEKSVLNSLKLDRS